MQPLPRHAKFTVAYLAVLFEFQSQACPPD
jgi:hypothetical protein